VQLDACGAGSSQSGLARAVRHRHRLRFFSGNSGTTLTAQQPLNNIIRSTVQCLGAVLGGAQSIHVMGYDEAFEIPSEEAVTLSLRTQQIIALETGVTRTVDPLAGSYYVEHLTDEIEARAQDLLDEVAGAGGMVAALATGLPQRWIADSAYQIERDLAEGRRLKVGVNVHRDEQPTPQLNLFEMDRLRRAAPGGTAPRDRATARCRHPRCRDGPAPRRHRRWSQRHAGAHRRHPRGCDGR